MRLDKLLSKQLAQCVQSMTWSRFSRQVEDFNAFTAPLAELGDALPLEAKSALVDSQTLLENADDSNVCRLIF